MRFLADESCDFALVRALRHAGYEVTTVRDALPGAPDEDVIELALREGRVLLTEDKDFGQLVFASSTESPGVMLIRFPASTRKTMANTVVELVKRDPAKVAKRFVVVQPGRIRSTSR